jgi:hypothetical protein
MYYNISVVLCEVRARKQEILNPLNAELNPICHPLALLGTHHILDVSRMRVKMYLNKI